MAVVVGKENFFNWLFNEEKQKLENQIKAFEIGLRGLYRNLFFKYINI